MEKKPTYKELEQKINELESKDVKHKRTEEELRDAYKTTQDIIGKAPFGIYVVNDEGYIDYVNPAMVKIAGDYYEQFKNLNAFDLPTYRKIGLSRNIKSGLNGRHFFMGAVKYTSFYGHKTTIRNFIGIPLIEKNKRKVLMIVEDITVAKVLENELVRHRQDLQQLVQKVVKEHTEIMIETNEQLKKDIDEQMQEKKELDKHCRHLQKLVKERTAELEKAKEQLT